MGKRDQRKQEKKGRRRKLKEIARRSRLKMAWRRGEERQGGSGEECNRGVGVVARGWKVEEKKDTACDGEVIENWWTGETTKVRYQRKTWNLQSPEQ